MDEISHDTKLFVRPCISEIRPYVGIFIMPRDISSKKKKKSDKNHPAKYLVHPDANNLAALIAEINFIRLFTQNDVAELRVPKIKHAIYLVQSAS